MRFGFEGTQYIDGQELRLGFQWEPTSNGNCALIYYLSPNNCFKCTRFALNGISMMDQ